MSKTNTGLISMKFPASVLLGGWTAKTETVIPGRGRCQQKTRPVVGPMDGWVGVGSEQVPRKGPLRSSCGVYRCPERGQPGEKRAEHGSHRT